MFINAAGIILWNCTVNLLAVVCKEAVTLEVSKYDDTLMILIQAYLESGCASYSCASSNLVAMICLGLVKRVDTFTRTKYCSTFNTSLLLMGVLIKVALSGRPC